MIGPTGKGLLTGRAVETTSSRVVIENYFSISKSPTLASEIFFGDINSLPAYQVNATGNNDSSGALGPTLYNITVSPDSNVIVDFCVRALGNLTIGGDENGPKIDLPNYTWANSTINDATHPAKFGKSFTHDFVLASQDVQIGGADHYRFWLNLSVNQAPGTYGNTIEFQGVPPTGSCT